MKTGDYCFYSRYRVSWTALWEWLEANGWQELNSVKWYGARDKIFLKPGTPYDHTGNRLYMYLPSDYCRDEFEMRRYLAVNTDEAALAWLREQQGSTWVSTQPAAAAIDDGRDATDAANRCHFCCVVSTPRVQLHAQADRGGVGRDSLRVLSGVVALSAAAESGPAPLPTPSVGGTSPPNLMELSADIHQHIMRCLSPGDATRLSQCSRYWHELCASELTDGRDGTTDTMWLGQWKRDAAGPVASAVTAIEDAALALPIHWLQVLRHVSLLSAVANGGSMEEIMVEVLGQTSDAVTAAGDDAVERLLKLEAAGRSPNAGRYLSLLGLRSKADDVSTKQRRRGAGRAELLRLCRQGAAQRWEEEKVVVPRHWHYSGQRRAWGLHPLRSQQDHHPSVCQDDDLQEERAVIGLSLGDGCVSGIDAVGTAGLLRHIECCDAAASAAAWWQEHWQSLAQPDPESQGNHGFLFCFGKPESQEALVLQPDLKHPDYRQAQKMAARNGGQGKVGTIDWCITCRKSGSFKCFCPVGGDTGPNARKELTVGGPPPPLGLTPLGLGALRPPPAVVGV